MIKEADEYKEEDDQQKLRIISRNALESYLFSARSALKEHEETMDVKEFEPIERLVYDHIEWLEYNREKEGIVYDEKLKYVQKVVTPFMEKVHKKSPRDSKEVQDADIEGLTIEEVKE